MDPAFNYQSAMQRVRQLLNQRRTQVNSVSQMAEYQRQADEAMLQLRKAKVGAMPNFEASAGFDNAQAQATGAMPSLPPPTGLVQRVAGKSGLFGVVGDPTGPGTAAAAKIETPKLAATGGIVRRKM